ncbi:Metallo-hydrolase/oxidoreductase [Basidiobolus meristosporus CBS 931.73]|uniref:Metallo-hydrolase/oxidoreductase n=1 Tax=Basidiobolus meristosporus CBS 931.73 TaxID=1314790 RepID=A0A1Y1Z7U6_9FUNG|nr:Metallo-hydrolase/oxidoreductase [Basidiobolus meristosporus CBS 931.73]|eukprot:ORY06276.1 Metallo-hydrolase/oxidoreductase [Basidiobolus meristosporus CBS 931.73]
MPQPLVPLPVFQKLSEKVSRILGLNPGKFTLQGTNTYLVGSGQDKILIDTGGGELRYSEALSGALKELGNARITSIVITHWHHDHVKGIPSVLDICRRQQRDGLVPVYKRVNPERDDTAVKFENIEDGQTFSVEGATLTAFHTPGHTTDHFVFKLNEDDSLFAGDNVLGQGTTVFENLNDYMNSLQRMLSLEPKVIYPGHGPVIKEGAETLREYISHRKAREDQILSCLKRIQTDPSYKEKYVLPSHLVEKIYAGYPKEIFPAAEKILTLHLEKLLSDSQVVYSQTNNSKKWSLA